jgi:hypothetical protein
MLGESRVQIFGNACKIRLELYTFDNEKVVEYKIANVDGKNKTKLNKLAAS